MQLVFLPFANNCDGWNETHYNSYDWLNKYDVIHKNPGFSSNEQQKIYEVYEIHRQKLSKEK